ncbi:vegetative incompatibility protein HET-E-1-like [Drosophila innubila]|uniref:vegetative incompatibility protein HET-E-1-like n=1 Tax=Drosophila innubila TaxID=198719 RepID=UPI00148C433B|nr:vegetative incompatibility protein HET-E-1-like [Drosophila innubila]
MEMTNINKANDPEEKRTWCCAWGLIKPEHNEHTSEDEEFSCHTLTVKQKPKEFVVTGGVETHLKVVHISPSEEHVFPYEYTLQLPGMGAHNVAVSPDCSTIAAVAVDGSLSLLDVKAGVRLPNISHRLVSNFWSTAFGGSNDSVYAGSGNGEVFKYDTVLGKLQHSYNTERCENILGLAISLDHRLIGASDYEGNITLIDGATGQLLRRGNFKCPMRKLVFDPSLCHALAACDDKTIKVIDLPSGKLRQSLKGHDAFVMSLAASPDGQRFVSGSCDGTMKIWDSNDKERIVICLCQQQESLGRGLQQAEQQGLLCGRWEGA